MPCAVLDQATLSEFTNRVNKVNEQSRREWGALDASQMLRHLTYLIEISLGEEISADRSNFVMRSIMRPIVFSSMQWPKGKIKAPPDLTPKPDGDCNVERPRLLKAMSRFVETSAKLPNEVRPHPVFGPVTLTYWRRMHGKHLDHHLKQFGA
jgi:hypothetical protein